ncbi:sensor histidine kinase [Pseudonocardia xishanensis]|uniref:histidine kinase n=1 Tax=Pseudonocardia xishanensis TaxID=630995 RepID=A0ABP8RJL9_9PSEU
MRIGEPLDRALAVLCLGAFATVVIGALGAGPAWPAIPLGAAFALVGTVGFGRVRRAGRWAAVGYVVVQGGLGYAVFTTDPGVGGTLNLVVLVSQCVLLLPLPATAVVVALTPFVHTGMPLAEAAREGVGTLAAVLFGAVVTELLRREQRARADLAAAHAEVARLATAQERNRVARDIHDELGHALSVVGMQLKAARAVLLTDPTRTDALLATAQHTAESALEDVRRSVRMLREPRSLPEALTALTTEVGADLTITGTPRPLPSEITGALRRAAQEGLTNARKHAAATRTEVVLDFGPGTVRVEVRDDGVGPRPMSATGFGLVGLRERAEPLGGRVELLGPPEGGSVLRMEVPG